MSKDENDMEELKGCPFPRCGGKGELTECVNKNITYRKYVKCASCGCSTKWSMTEVGAITMWNTRPKEENGGAIAEALEMVDRLEKMHYKIYENQSSNQVGNNYLFSCLADEIRSTLKGTE